MLLEFRHWHAVEELTLEQAGQLIAGVDPSDPGVVRPDDVARAKTYETAIRQAVGRAWLYAYEYLNGEHHRRDSHLPDIWEGSGCYDRYLPSIELRASVTRCLQDPENVTLNPPVDPHHSETVQAGEMQRWLEANGIDSYYRFQAPQWVILDSVDRRRLTEGQERGAHNREEPLQSDAASSGPWPWGDYETPLLREMAGAAMKFWALYDPSDPTTAPRSVAVVAWLRSQGVAQRTAEVMATILRADGLPTGPR